MDVEGRVEKRHDVNQKLWGLYPAETEMDSLCDAAMVGHGLMRRKRGSIKPTSTHKQTHRHIHNYLDFSLPCPTSF